MIEVFKTNIKENGRASRVVEGIQKSFKDHSANIDLQDIDNILRVECSNGSVATQQLLNLIEVYGHKAVVLEG